MAGNLKTNHIYNFTLWSMCLLCKNLNFWRRRRYESNTSVCFSIGSVITIQYIVVSPYMIYTIIDLINTNTFGIFNFHFFMRQNGLKVDYRNINSIILHFRCNMLLCIISFSFIVNAKFVFWKVLLITK